MLDDVFIHIGLPKTATTTIQNRFFSELDGIYYIGKPTARNGNEDQILIHKITDQESLEFDIKNVKSNFKKKVGHFDKIILSEETFSTGSTLNGRVDRKEIAYRLNEIAPNAKIILVLREQKSIIKSFYLQEQKNNKNPKYKSFSSWIEGNRSLLYQENVFQYFYYDKLIELYQTLFGKDKVCILFFEDLKNNPENYLSDLLKALKLECRSEDFQRYLDLLVSNDDNSTVTSRLILIKRVSSKLPVIKKIFPATIKEWIGRYAMSGEKIKISLSPNDEEYINDLYRESNRKVELITGINLKARGYSV